MATSTPVDIGSLIIQDPHSNFWRPVCAGSRVTVFTIGARYVMGESPEEILDSFSHLDLARIYAALAYYFANRTQIDHELDELNAWADRMMRKYPNGIVSPFSEEDEMPPESTVQEAELVDIDSLLHVDPDRRQGRPTVVGSRVTVHTIAAWHLRGDPPEEILASLPHLDPAGVFAALAWFFANRQRVEADLDADRKLGEKLART